LIVTLGGYNGVYLLRRLATSSIFASSIKAGLFLLFSLRAIFVKKLEKLRSSVLVECVGELSDGWGDLKTFRKNNSLTLKTNVFRPFNKTCQVTFRLNVLAFGVII
jgi:hypothetical protein